MKKFKKVRQQLALERLEDQLKSNTKTAKKSQEKVDLTDQDIRRIEQEIEKLKKSETRSRKKDVKKEKGEG